MTWEIRPPDGQVRYVPFEEQLAEKDRAKLRRALIHTAKIMADIVDQQTRDAFARMAITYD